MDYTRNTDSGKSEESHIHCPYCDKKFFTATVIVDMNFKCEKCHRRYLINVQDGNVYIKLVSKPKENNID